VKTGHNFFFLIEFINFYVLCILCAIKVLCRLKSFPDCDRNVHSVEAKILAYLISWWFRHAKCKITYFTWHLLCTLYISFECQPETGSLWEQVQYYRLTLNFWHYNYGCSLARAVQGGAKVLFWVCEYHPDTSFKDNDTKYWQHRLRARWVANSPPPLKI
jgi:hypothetical protein